MRQLILMTDDTGLFQHAVHHLPDPNHGYCIDDNCRALLAAVMHARLFGHDESVVPLQRYLTFCTYALNADNGRFRNFMGYNRHWLEDIGSQDSHARTIWALGTTVRYAPTSAVGGIADTLFQKGLAAIERDFTFIRPNAYAILGLAEYAQRSSPPSSSASASTSSAESAPLPAVAHHDALSMLDRLASRLLEQFQNYATDDWPWWEAELTWGNAKLPHALLAAGDVLDRPDMIDAGLRALRWCLDVQTVADENGRHLSIIGNDGWFTRAGHRAQFDQQPIEAQGLVQACLCAARIVAKRDDITGGSHENNAQPATAAQWVDEAWMCFTWFRGNNDLGVLIHHDETGGCQDGLQPQGVNKNQGAESILAYLLCVLEFRLFELA